MSVQEKLAEKPLTLNMNSLVSQGIIMQLPKLSFFCVKLKSLFLFFFKHSKIKIGKYQNSKSNAVLL